MGSEDVDSTELGYMVDYGAAVLLLLLGIATLVTKSSPSQSSGECVDC